MNLSRIETQDSGASTVIPKGPCFCPSTESGFPRLEEASQSRRIDKRAPLIKPPYFTPWTPPIGLGILKTFFFQLLDRGNPPV
jgi:hypothetical protein